MSIEFETIRIGVKELKGILKEWVENDNPGKKWNDGADVLVKVKLMGIEYEKRLEDVGLIDVKLPVYKVEAD